MRGREAQGARRGPEDQPLAARLRIALLALALAGAALAYGQAAEPLASAPREPTAALQGLTAPLLLGLLILLLGALQARAAPRKKRALGRAVLIYAVYLAGSALRAALQFGAYEAWARRLAFLNLALALLVLANLGAGLLFDVLAPALRMRLASILGDLAVGAAYVVVALWAAHQLGVNVTGLLATSAIVTAIVGLSLQGTISNAVGGLALQLDDSFAVGDWIELDGKAQGVVREIRWRHTLVETRNWETLVVPNAVLLSQTIKILGKREGQPLQQRMWVYFNVDFRFSPADVVRVVEEALRSASIPNVALLPPPNCICLDLAGDGRDSFARYAVRYWLTELAVDDPTSSVVRQRIHAALRRAAIPLALPGAAVFLSEDDPEHARRKSEREQRARAAQLEHVALFASMTPEEKASLAERMSPAPFVPGEVITREGAVAHWLYVLAAGEVAVQVETQDGTQSEIARLRAPDVFGEMGLMTGQPRRATIVALTSVDCYRIDKEHFEDILRGRPAMAAAISGVLAARNTSLSQAQSQLDGEERKSQFESDAHKILASIEQFFGLSDSSAAE